MHHLVVSGSPFERGVASGKFESELLYRQEKALFDRLREIFPGALLLKVLQVGMIRWFWGADRFFPPEDLEEMDGVSRSSPPEFAYLGNAYVRQIYYHGLHEVGQMMVDQTGDDMGCTVAAYPLGRGWIVGRNFDFEGGRIFDTDKVLKWVFPDRGYAFVSVIWSGMVGAVTGVNEHGLYVSINAAGARDFRRYGTPTTLVLLQALQFARTSEEAVKIIMEAETFITDIFVVSDTETGRFFRVEKAPSHTEAIELKEPSIVTNHLVADYWKEDKINKFRRDELTSHARLERGEKLMASLKADAPTEPRRIEEGILGILRDKGEARGEPLALGNRNAIDALIATHAVVYDGPERRLYVSQGPSLAGAFTGFDLVESFKKREPVLVRGFDRDPLVSDEAYASVKRSDRDLVEAGKLLKKGKCAEAAPLIESARSRFSLSYGYSMTRGNYLECVGDRAGARIAWREALSRTPAYASERRSLERKLEQK
jgi:hypothetical protein